MNFMKIRHAVLILITCRQAGMMELRSNLELPRPNNKNEIWWVEGKILDKYRKRK
jgi:hypothetical protein